MNAIQIRRADVAEDIRTLAELMNSSITDAIATAVRNQLSVERAKADQVRRERKMRSDELLAELWRLPIVGPILTDDDLYDEDGMPK